MSNQEAVRFVFDVFISYAREDQPMARRLAAAFEAEPRGWSVWWDAHLNPAQRFGQEIRRALESSRCVLAVWSPHSVESDWVTAEAEAGRKRGVLIPVRVAECEPPMPFGQIQAADLKGWRGSQTDPEWSKLLEAIQAVMAKGIAVDSDEREQRRLRMHRVKGRRLRRYASIAAGLLALTAFGWWITGEVSVRQEAGRIAALSVEVRKSVSKPTAEEEQKKVWWWRLFDGRGPLEQLELGVLLGVEAMRRADTQVTREALRDALALLPWADIVQPIDSNNEPTSMVFSADSRWLAVAGGRGETLVWDFEQNQIVTRIPHGGSGGRDREKQRGGIGAGPMVVAFSPDADLLATAGPDETVRLWNPSTGLELRRLSHDAVASSVRFSPDGARLAATDEGGGVRLWDPRSGELIHDLHHDRVSRKVFFSPSGRYLGTVGRDHVARVWEVVSGRELVQWQQKPASGGYIRGLTFSPHEQSVVTYGIGIPITLWELETGNKLWEIADVDAGGAVFSTNGSVLVTGGYRRMTWWDVAAREQQFFVPVDYLNSIESDTAKRVIATRDSLGSLVQAWDFESGRELRRIPYAKWPTASAVDPAGLWLASTGDDWLGGKRLLEVVRIEPHDLITEACEKASRNLTKDEWQEYFARVRYRRTCPDVPDDEKQ